MRYYYAVSGGEIQTLCTSKTLCSFEFCRFTDVRKVLGIVERHIELAQERLQEIREGFVRVAEVLKTEMMDALDMDEEQIEARLREDMAGRT